jgi:hypothetical protein
MKEIAAESTDEQTERLKELLNRVAHHPTVADLWKLRGTLLACTQGRADGILVDQVACEFYLYLSDVQSKLTARQFNALASRLDIGSVGLVALQNLMTHGEGFWPSLLLGGAGEGLMVLASRQYIKAWEQELQSVQRRAAWTLYGVLWQLSSQNRPELSADARRAMIEATLAPAVDEDTPFEAQMLLMMRLFQTLLLVLSAPLCGT